MSEKTTYKVLVTGEGFEMLTSLTEEQVRRIVNLTMIIRQEQTNAGELDG